MKQVEETTTVWYSEDGKKFLSERECQNYESNQKVLEVRWGRMSFYHSYCKPDLTEGRGWYGEIFIAVESDYSADEEGRRNIALAAMFTLFGCPIAFVQACSPMHSWRLKEIGKENFLKRGEVKARVGSYSYTSMALFLSTVGNMEGMPKAACVGPNITKKSWLEDFVEKAK